MARDRKAPPPGGRTPPATAPTPGAEGAPARPRNRRGRMSDEDAALWAAVKRTVTPLRDSEREPPLVLAAASEPLTAATATPPAAAVGPVAPKRPLPPPAPPALQPLARKERQKLVRGTTAIDGRIDLHGLTQAEAHARLYGFLASAQARGARAVLVITGKGGGGGGEGFEALHRSERGVLRRQVPLWLSLAEFRPLVLGFEEAHFVHGGAGALYVRIRRRKGG